MVEEPVAEDRPVLEAAEEDRQVLDAAVEVQDRPVLDAADDDLDLEIFHDAVEVQDHPVLEAVPEDPPVLEDAAEEDRPILEVESVGSRIRQVSRSLLHKVAYLTLVCFALYLVYPHSPLQTRSLTGLRDRISGAPSRPEYRVADRVLELPRI